MSNERERRLAKTFVALSDTLVDDFDVLDFLTMLAERAAELLDVTAAGVILSDQRGGWHPTAASSEDAQLLELFAIQTREGPCQDSIRTAATVSSADLAADDSRWPSFSDVALTRGFHAATAVPMRLRHEVIGVLTLLNIEPVSVDEDSTQLGQAMADVATIGLLRHRPARQGELLAERLQATLHHRVIIEQAKGVLAERGGLSMRQAFELLRSYARAQGQNLSDVAHGVANNSRDTSDMLSLHRQGERRAEA